MFISNFSIEQPVFVNLFMILIIIAGFFAFNRISKEELAEFMMTQLVVNDFLRRAVGIAN